MLSELIVRLVAVVCAVPMTAVLLRRVRSRTRRDLARRVARGEIMAGVPANWLGTRPPTRWSGCLVVDNQHSLRWEPDKASTTKRRASPRAWQRGEFHIELCTHGRGFTGERYERVALVGHGAPVATLVVFAEVGPWHEAVGLD